VIFLPHEHRKNKINQENGNNERREEGILEVGWKEISPTSNKNYVFGVCPVGNGKK